MLSLGPVLKFNGSVTDTALPFAALGPLPLINAALPSRLALIIGPVLGILLALRRRPAACVAAAGAGPGAVWAIAFAVALVPLIPAAAADPATRRRSRTSSPPAPGSDYVSPGGVLTPLPLALDVTPDGQRWQAYALANSQGRSSAIPSGFFLGPGGPDGRGKIGPVDPYVRLDWLCHRPRQTGRVPTVTRAHPGRRPAGPRLLGRDSWWSSPTSRTGAEVAGPRRRRTAGRRPNCSANRPSVDDVWIWTEPAGGWIR